MGVVIPNWEGERRPDTADTIAIPTKDEFDAVVDRVNATVTALNAAITRLNATAAQLGGAVGALTAVGTVSGSALTHSDPTTHGG